MEDLLKPDYGVMILTICNFLLLVYLLKKFAWNGLIGALDKREAQIAQDVEQARQARSAAEALKQELDGKWAQIAAQAAQQMAQAVKTGEAQREQLVQEARAQAERLIAQAKEQIEAEKNQALSEVRGEIVRTSILAAQQVLQEQLNEKAASQTVERVLEEVKAKQK